MTVSCDFEKFETVVIFLDTVLILYMYKYSTCTFHVHVMTSFSNFAKEYVKMELYLINCKRHLWAVKWHLNHFLHFVSRKV